MSQHRVALLHSRYNPQGEADRYIASLSLDENTRFFILIEPGLGYMIAPLRKKNPSAKIIALHTAAAPADAALPDSRWHPETGIPVQDFLESEIPDSAAAEIRILEWRPALAVYGSSYLALVEESAKFIKRADANVRTANAFGKRWFRNFFRNIEIIRRVLRPSPLSLPLLVTGAGPSLEESLPLVKQTVRKNSLFVLAVSSSLAALKAADVPADMVISTDGGQWAAFHLLDCFRGSCPPLAASLTAALPSQCALLPVLPVSDGSLWQTLILRELKIPFVVLPQRGTVSASALDLAFALTSGGVFISGLDLANCGIRSHARPYSLDRFFEEKSGRTSPVYSQAFKRSSLMEAGGSYAIYASWFEKQLAAYPNRIYSLGKNNRIFSTLKATQTIEGCRNTGNVVFETITLSGNSRRRAFGVLEKALHDPLCSQALQKELISIVPGSKANTCPHELLQTLRPLAGGT